MLLDDDDPSRRLENHARVATPISPLLFGLRVERRPAKIGKEQRVAARCDSDERIERWLIFGESLP
jgi:hypothetical protein